MDSIWEKVISESQLISLPEVYLKLQQVINNDDYAMADVVEVISMDPAITARLLRMVNSSFFGLATKIDTVNHAINYLGTQQVQDLVLSTSIAQTFNDMSNAEFNMHMFWQQSVYSAIAARELAVLCNVLNSERLFLIGLLRDVGHLMMYQSIPEHMQQAHELAEKQHISLPKAEQLLFDFDFTRVGSTLLQHWNLPDSLTEAIQFQLQPAQADSFRLEASIVNIAGLLTQTFKDNETLDENAFVRIDPTAADLTQITQDHCLVIDKMVRGNLLKVINLLFPQYRMAV